MVPISIMALGILPMEIQTITIMINTRAVGNQIKVNITINRAGIADYQALLVENISTMVFGVRLMVVRIMETMVVIPQGGNRIRKTIIINRDGIADFHPILVGGIFTIANGTQLMETQIVREGKDTIQVEGEGVSDSICSNIGKIKNSFFR